MRGTVYVREQHHRGGVALAGSTPARPIRGTYRDSSCERGGGREAAPANGGDCRGEVITEEVAR